MSASTMKMPEPIMEPITSAVELKRPRLCASLGALGGRAALEMGVCSWVVTYSKF
jgi:hypothetical protein